MVRNAVDHGSEPRAERTAKSKPAEGRLRCTPSTRGKVVIDLTDDGGGSTRSVSATRQSGPA